MGGDTFGSLLTTINPQQKKRKAENDVKANVQLQRLEELKGFSFYLGTKTFSCHFVAYLHLKQVCERDSEVFLGFHAISRGELAKIDSAV